MLRDDNHGPDNHTRVDTYNVFSVVGRGDTLATSLVSTMLGRRLWKQYGLVADEGVAGL